MKFRKGDTVKVTAGKDKGKTGKIEKVIAADGLVVVSGVNMYKRHLKATDPKRPAGIIDIVRPLHIGNIAVVCPKCNQVTRVGFSFEDGKKVRICRKCESRLTG